MSGGHWNYNQFKIDEMLKEVAKDHTVYTRFTKLSQILFNLSDLLRNVIHKIDYDICGDTIIKNDKEFEKEVIKELGKIINKKLKVKIYEIKED